MGRKTKLTPKMKTFIEENQSKSNRSLAIDLERLSGIRVSHTIVGIYKRTLDDVGLFYEKGLTTFGINKVSKVSKVERKKVSKVERKKVVRKTKIIKNLDSFPDPKKYYLMIDDYLRICSNRATSKRILKRTGKVIIDSIIKDIQNMTS